MAKRRRRGLAKACRIFVQKQFDYSLGDVWVVYERKDGPPRRHAWSPYPKNHRLSHNETRGLTDFLKWFKSESKARAYRNKLCKG